MFVSLELNLHRIGFEISTCGIGACVVCRVIGITSNTQQATELFGSQENFFRCSLQEVHTRTAHHIAMV